MIDVHNRRLVPALFLVGAVLLFLPLPTALRAVGSACLAFALFRMGYAMIRGLGTPVPGPLPAGELRRVKLVYRCSSCGAEVRMTHAPDENPAPPRHCMDEMDLIKRAEDFL